MSRIPPLDPAPPPADAPHGHHATVRVFANQKLRRVILRVSCCCSGRARFVSTANRATGKTDVDVDVARRGRVSKCPALVFQFMSHTGCSRDRAERALDHGTK